MNDCSHIIKDVLEEEDDNMLNTRKYFMYRVYIHLYK